MAKGNNERVSKGGGVGEAGRVSTWRYIYI